MPQRTEAQLDEGLSAAEKSGLFKRTPHKSPPPDTKPPEPQADDGLFDPGYRW